MPCHCKGLVEQPPMEYMLFSVSNTGSIKTLNELVDEGWTLQMYVGKQNVLLGHKREL